jgi:hypothetical protein
VDYRKRGLIRGDVLPYFNAYLGAGFEGIIKLVIALNKTKHSKVCRTEPYDFFPAKNKYNDFS